MIRKIFVLVILTTLLFPIQVFAVTQGSDEVTLIKPSQGESVSGTFNVEWKIVDSDVNDPAYFIDIFNLSCNQSGGNIGRLLSSGATKNGNSYNYQWDTSKGEVSSSLQNQGNYCMRVCSILADGANVYSLCDKQSFVFTSGGQTQGNKPPVIDSTEDSFDLDLNEVFNHTISANDEDDDKLTFSFVSAPSFLSIHPESGKITGKPTEVGNIKFIVKVDDGRGGIATQEYILNIGVPGAKKDVEIKFPKSNSVVSAEDNTIEWEINSNIQVRTIVLSFSQNKSDWTELTRLDRNTGSYDWNINDLEPGEYYLRIQVTDTSNKLYEVVSEKFGVSDAVAVDQTEITDLSPSEGSVLSDKRPVISAKFNTPEGVTINTADVTFMLNERIDLTVCDITGNGITCNVVSELLDGQYKAYIELLDSNGSTIVKEWPFTVQTSSTGGVNISSGGVLQLVLIILAIGFVLIALPWSLYFFWKRRKSLPKEEPTQVIHPVGGTDVSTPTQTENAAPSEPHLPEVAITSQPESTPQPLENQTMQQTGTDTQAMPSEITPSSVQDQSQNFIGEQNIQNVNVPTQIAETHTDATNPDLTQSTPQVTTPVDSVNTHPNVEVSPSSTMPEPPKTLEPPAMYAKDTIPQWMQGTNEDVKPAKTEESETSEIENIVNETEVAEGARVYDPYGIALNSDEVQSNNDS